MDLLQVAVTAVGAFVALFLLSKLMGHRQISELSVFDYVNGITIGSIAAEMATELENRCARSWPWWSGRCWCGCSRR